MKIKEVTRGTEEIERRHFDIYKQHDVIMDGVSVLTSAYRHFSSHLSRMISSLVV